MIGLLLVILVLLPGHVFATVFWDDELESGNTGYAIADLVAQGASGAMSYDTSVKFSGSGSLRYNFDASCYPDANAQANCGGFLDRTFTATNDLYKRFYIRLSSGFIVSDIFTKLMRTDGSNTSIPPSDWWTIGSNGSKDFVAVLQGVAAGGDTINAYTSFTFADAIWYCVETREANNTPGVSNGIAQAWVDGVEVLNLTNVKYLQTGQSNPMNSNRLYRQTGIGNIWFDRLAVGDTRIGCLAGGGGSTAGGGLDF